MKVKYKSNRRAVLQLQTHPDGEALSRTKPLLAGGLYLNYKDQIKYPEDCVTEKQRKDYRNTLGIR
jgi:hypothetical protein